MIRRLADQELGLWRRVARTVRPLATGNAVLELSKGELKPEFDALLISDGDSSHGEEPPLASRTKVPSLKEPDRARPYNPNSPGRKPQAPPANMSALKRVRRGRIEITARLDLHGLTEDEAVRELTSFVIRQRAVGCRCGLVITGKGRQGAGLLRRRFVDWLSSPDIRPAVSGYSVAGPRHGGEGAFYLFFRSAT